jgi:hypothetical protein
MESPSAREFEDVSGYGTPGCADFIDEFLEVLVIEDDEDTAIGDGCAFVRTVESAVYATVVEGEVVVSPGGERPSEEFFEEGSCCFEVGGLEFDIVYAVVSGVWHDLALASSLVTAMNLGATTPPPR